MVLGRRKDSLRLRPRPEDPAPIYPALIRRESALNLCGTRRQWAILQFHSEQVLCRGRHDKGVYRVTGPPIQESGAKMFGLLRSDDEKRLAFICGLGQTFVVENMQGG